VIDQGQEGSLYRPGGRQARGSEYRRGFTRDEIASHRNKKMRNDFNLQEGHLPLRIRESKLPYHQRRKKQREKWGLVSYKKKRKKKV